MAIATLGIIASLSVLAAKPHLVFILQDDLGHDDIAFNGNTNASYISSNISNLAREGIVLKRHYVHWHCSPTRRSFISGRLPIHHHEQLSGVSTDDLDLRYTWISAKLTSAGYEGYWFGKGHTGYKSMAHLPTSNGFKHFVGFLSGSQSYYASDRWEDEHPLHDDDEFVNPPPNCVANSTAATLSRYTEPPAETCPPTKSSLFQNTKFAGCKGGEKQVASPSIDDCCTICQTENCSHWTWSPTPPTCSTFMGGECQRDDSNGSVSAVAYHPKPSPPSPPGPDACATSYSSDLYGKLAVNAVATHDPSVPLFLYLPFQAVHTPYNAPPSQPSNITTTYAAMIWDADVYVGAILNSMRAKGMYTNSVIVYSSDNGGTGDGVNFPLRGEKHTNWEGGMRVAAFVAGGLIPMHLRGTSAFTVLHIVDWYPTFCFLAGVDGTDNPPVPPLPVDPSNPDLDIYGNHSFPALDGVNVWPILTDGTLNQNVSAAHEYLVLSKEVIIAGDMKLLVAQNNGWSHGDDNGWKNHSSGFENITGRSYACDQTDLPGDLQPGAWPGIPGSLPCLFDVGGDMRETTDLLDARSNPDPTTHARAMALWTILNHTHLTAFCRNVNNLQGCNSSPEKMLGPCNAACAAAYWEKISPGKGGGGPICGVPGCTPA
eukprot:m.200923 g.200923  ORF g.200923 m.200923 type:complete len:656 (-) comp32783_c0_seq1:107-2074(-)